MIYYCILIITLVFPYETSLNNSIFNSSKSPRVSSLGNCYFLSENLGDVFYAPTNVYSNLSDKLYFSLYSALYDNLDITQISYNIFETKKEKINLGILHRVIKDNYNTENLDVWNDNGDNIPEYSEINYDAINSYNDEEIGFLFSYNYMKNNYIFNFKLKPSIHFIDHKNAYGIDSDFFITYFRDKYNISIGLVDFSFKKWNNGTSEFRVPSIAGFSSISFNSTLLIINYYKSKLRLGLEYSLLNNIFLRLGINENNILTYGFGINIGFIELNYTSIKVDNLEGNINQFSLLFDFKNIKSFF